MDKDEGPRRQQARRLLSQGLEAFRRGEYVLAIEAFRKGNAIEPHRHFLFAIGQAYRLSGDCRQAIGFYSEFLKNDPPQAQADAARAMQERCESDVRAAEPPPTLESVAPPPEAPPPVVLHAPPPRRPFYRDTVGNVLLGGGVVGLGVGVWALVGASVPEAGTQTTYGEYADAADRASDRRVWGWVGVAAGTGLVTAAVLRYRSVSKSEPRSGLTATVIAPSGGMGFAVGGSF